jgi:hypothetical protein
VPNQIKNIELFIAVGRSFFLYSRSYQGRNFAPRKSTPSVSIAKASGVSFNFGPSLWPGLGQLKVPRSSRLLKIHKPVPSK